MLTSGALATGRRDKRGRVKPAHTAAEPDDDGYLAASLVPCSAMVTTVLGT